MITFFGDYIPRCPCEYEFPDGICIGNLECAFSDGEVASGKAYTSVLATETMDNIRTSGFSAFSVANNHVRDAGNFDETLRSLRDKFPDKQFFGTTDRPYAQFAADGRSIAVVGCLERCRCRGRTIFPEEKVLPLLRRLKPEFDLVYVYPHWGKEGELTRYPSPAQRRKARRWIEAGADGVIGHHSHIFQGFESFDGKPVYYSLGNFFFPHPEGDQYAGTHDGMSVSISADGSVSRTFHHFDSDGRFSAGMTDAESVLAEISEQLPGMGYWRWAGLIGGLYLRKNLASWKVRIRKRPLVNLPKFLVCCFLPHTILFQLRCVWDKICGRSR